MQRSVGRITLFLFLLISAGTNLYAGDTTMKNLKEIPHITQPQPNRYSAGQPDPTAFPALANAGVKHIINLRPPTETPDANEAALVTKAGMAYYNIPITGADDLTRDNVILIDKILRQIGDETALIHCSTGNRVGALMALKAAWLENKSFDEAMAIGKNWGLTRLQPTVEQLIARQPLNAMTN